ncbi:hypothetical protein [Paractinoplanes durhamensis]|uniref:Lipoprotein n=1 Tax=Paractinoplanes durhamensis TaxID=113563 RepID=A0ABQ3Z2J8_9ACTN|nr:hypothetical protein [Actinoplanes durhamensis]GIE04052.1 hypothetical protein Adu01nite_54020 [Actinoplanes durhamensis]
MPSRLRLTVTGLATVAVLLGSAGCTGLDEASAAGISRDDLVSEMAVQLARVTGLTYTATYQLAGGTSATVTQAQKPARTAYVYPGGRLIEETTGTTRCTGDTALKCTRTDPAPATATPLSGSTLITPEAALALLNTASLDQDVEAGQHDTTIAGRHATCLDLKRVDGTPTAEFGVCVTNEGALGSFTATIAGQRFEQALTAYEEKVEPDAFALPASATVSDKRTR